MMPLKTRSVNLNNKYMDGEEKDKLLKKKKSTLIKQNNLAPDSEVAKVIRDALLIHLINNDRRRENLDDLEAMVSTCQEFMKSFIILGYNFNGEPIQPIVFAHNQQEADALGAYLSKFIQNMNRESSQNG
jgi:hypothetical protein